MTTTRRSFIKTASAAVAGSALPWPQASAASKPDQDVTVIRYHNDPGCELCAHTSIARVNGQVFRKSYFHAPFSPGCDQVDSIIRKAVLDDIRAHQKAQ